MDTTVLEIETADLKYSIKFLQLHVGRDDLFLGGLNKELRILNPDLILDLLHYKTYLDILLFFLYIFITARNLICKIMIDDGRTQSSTKEIIFCTWAQFQREGYKIRQKDV